ncbi:MAG: HAD family phosphatase [Lachnospiraceae bacterium]|nr:HAD family phosphatase [Lachnospiraceae bacterium]
MLTNIKACIFDLDGTVVDSMWIWRSIDHDYLAIHGYEVPDDMAKDIEGSSMKEVAKYFKNRFHIEDDIDKIVNDWNDMALMKYTNDVTLKPHIDEFLSYLKNNNIKVGLSTSNSMLLAKAVLKARGIYDYFDAMSAGCSDIKGKPAPDIYLKTADMLSVDPSECLVFEDLIKGLNAGINAGMKTCAVKDEYSMYQWEEKIKLADYFIEDYHEVFKK